MAQVQPAEELTAAFKLAQRNGKCLAVGVDCDCDAFAHWKKMDGYDTCVCTHTKWSHAREAR